MLKICKTLKQKKTSKNSNKNKHSARYSHETEDTSFY